MGSESTDKTSFYVQVKVQPCSEQGHGINGGLIVVKVPVGLDNIDIEYEPIQSPFRLITLMKSTRIMSAIAQGSKRKMKEFEPFKLHRSIY